MNRCSRDLWAQPAHGVADCVVDVRRSSCGNCGEIGTFIESSESELLWDGVLRRQLPV